VFAGILSTILSTPCSAPFLGTALAFAFTGNTFTIMLVFTFVGLGLAFPFLLTGIFPRLISFLPRPGAWMEKLKYFLGLTLLLTVAWLATVFLSLVDPALWLWPLGLLLISLFFGFFFRARISRNWGLNLLFFVLPVGMLLGALKTLPLTPPAVNTDKTSLWKPWSPAALQEFKGQWVFMDFTAQWCLTCKVNKKLVLDTSEFEMMATKRQLRLVRGDWTQRDETIAKFLESHGVYGVPAYFLQRPDGTVIKLGETVSIGKVEGHIR
jgi:thiol:disulfide interchange protein